MKIENSLHANHLREIGPQAQAAERAGFDGVWTLESAHDSFLRLLVAAEHTKRVDVVSAILIAFARTPMTVAYSAWDLQEAAGGRFVMGLGSQVKAHIERRFGMPWSHPAPRMREFVLALRQIWQSWETGEKLDFRGDFYEHTLMAPVFSPGPAPYGPPPVFLAGVGAVMTTVAGEVGDGFVCHPFHTEAYVRNVLVPAIEKGLARSGRQRSDFQISCPVMVVTGRDEQELEARRERVRGDLAFHASTPAYRVVLEQHGWEDLQSDLHALAKAGRWDDMAPLVDDEVVRTFAVVGEPQELPALLRARFGGVADRISFYPPDFNDPLLWEPILEDLRKIPGGREAAVVSGRG
jgi:probable F420-dependent oxidoreductase